GRGRLGGREPDLCRDAPAEEVDAREGEQRQREDEQADTEREPVLVEPHVSFIACRPAGRHEPVALRRGRPAGYKSAAAMDEPPRRALSGEGLAIVVLAATVTMLARLWEGDFHRDEVLYAAVAKTMAAGGDWLSLHLGGDPYWRKPPLVFWLAAAAYRTLGYTAFAGRLFP